MPASCWFVATLSPWQLMVSKSPCVDAQRIHMIIAGIVVRRVSKWLQKWWQNWHRICFGTATGSIQVLSFACCSSPGNTLDQGPSVRR